MANWTEDVANQASASDAHEARFSSFIVNAASATDASEPKFAAFVPNSATAIDQFNSEGGTSLADIALVSDGVALTGFTPIVERASAVDTLSESASVAVNLAASAVSTSSMVSDGPLDITDSATSTDSRSLSTRAILADTTIASDDPLWSAVGNQDISDTTVGAGAFSGADVGDVSDSAVSSDAHSIVFKAAVNDMTGASDSLTGTALRSFTLVDTALSSETVQITLRSDNTLVDTVSARDSVSYKQPGAVAWLMNTESGGASWYSNYQFTDIAQVGNLVLAVGPEGLSLHEGALDSGDTVDAGVTWGFTEFGGYDRDGNPQENVFKKRVSDFWLGYTSDGVLEASVETYKNGDPVYTYEMPQRDAEQSTNNCIKPGLGLNARYWRIGINNVGGCDFAVDSLIAHVAQSTRRI